MWRRPVMQDLISVMQSSLVRLLCTICSCFQGLFCADKWGERERCFIYYLDESYLFYFLFGDFVCELCAVFYLSISSFTCLLMYYHFSQFSFFLFLLVELSVVFFCLVLKNVKFFLLMASSFRLRLFLTIRVILKIYLKLNRIK